MTTADIEPPSLERAVPEGSPAKVIPHWSTAVATLTECELSAVVMRIAGSGPVQTNAYRRKRTRRRALAHVLWLGILPNLEDRRQRALDSEQSVDMLGA